MSARAGFLLVARREFSERLRQRSFQVSTATTMLIIAAVAVLPGVIGGDGPQRFQVGAVGVEGNGIAAASGAVAPDFDSRVEVTRLASVAAATRQLRDGKLDAAVVPGPRMLSEEDLSDKDLGEILQVGSKAFRSEALLRSQGLSPAEIRRALDPPALRAATLEEGGEDRDEKQAFAFAAALLLYGQLITYGLWVAMGVVEEKASRVVEILLATVRPGVLLAGKIVGLGALGLLQLVLVVVVGLVLAAVSGSVELDGSVVSVLPVVLAWFLLGYALYACLYAISGALVSSQEDLQSSSTPLTIALVLAFFITLPALDDPSSGLARIASLVPLSAPLTMPSRIVLGEAPAWEVGLSLVLMLVTIAALIPLGARIYAGGVLRIGKPLKLREALRSRGAA